MGNNMDFVRTIDDGIVAVLNTCGSPNTYKQYRRVLYHFRGWLLGRSFDDTAVRSYVMEMETCQCGHAVIKLNLAAICALAAVMAAHGALSANQALSIALVRRPRGVRSAPQGQPLNDDDVKRLLNAPNETTIKGARDRAILATLLGCGLSLYECASLQVADIGASHTVSVMGSGGKRRSVSLPDWTRVAIEAHQRASGVWDGFLFRSVRKGDRLQDRPMPEVCVSDVVSAYTKQVGLSINLRDLRQTAIVLSVAEATDYRARIAELESECNSLRRSLALKSALPPERLRSVIAQPAE